MKKLIAIAVLTLTISVSAQEKKADKMDHHRSKDKMEMFSNLNLTEKQKTEIKALWDEKKEDHQAFKASKADKREFSEAEKAEYKAKKEASQKEMDAKLQTILTPEQYKQYVSEREKRHQEMKARKQKK